MIFDPLGAVDFSVFSAFSRCGEESGDKGAGKGLPAVHGRFPRTNFIRNLCKFRPFFSQMLEGFPKFSLGTTCLFLGDTDRGIFVRNDPVQLRRAFH